MRGEVVPSFFISGELDVLDRRRRRATPGGEAEEEAGGEVTTTRLGFSVDGGSVARTGDDGGATRPSRIRECLW